MNGLSFPRPTARLTPVLCLVLVAASWLAGPSVARAAPAAPPGAAAAVAAPFAEDDGWSVRKLFSGLNSRTRVIQVAILFMCLSLYIIVMRRN